MQENTAFLDNKEELNMLHSRELKKKICENIRVKTKNIFFIKSVWASKIKFFIYKVIVIKGKGTDISRLRRSLSFYKPLKLPTYRCFAAS